jgi:hypothetical protein
MVLRRVRLAMSRQLLNALVELRHSAPQCGNSPDCLEDIGRAASAGHVHDL